MKNIAYQTDHLAQYFARNRVTWQQFYESERIIIERIGIDSRHEILDIGCGCGCGGLGMALEEQFGVAQYTGIEINSQAAEVGRALNPRAIILCGDVLEVSQNEIKGKCFDVVFSLSCVDWNVQYADMLAAAWRHVLPGGCLVATFRLCVGEGNANLEQTYQYINFEGMHEGERAAYVVLNAKALIDQLDGFRPEQIDAYGYWGKPSETAVTPYDSLCFAAFSIKKRSANDMNVTRYRLELPAEILESMELQAR